MNDFWKSDSKKFDLEKAPAEHLKVEEFDFDALLSKYGPEGLWELADKLRQVALDDVEAGRIARWTGSDEEDACYR